MNRKIQALTIEIAQLQKQMNVGRGEQSILAQQQKDTSKRVDILCVGSAAGARAGCTLLLLRRRRRRRLLRLRLRLPRQAQNHCPALPRLACAPPAPKLTAHARTHARTPSPPAQVLHGQRALGRDCGR
jgi:hypothetical protein